MTYIKTLTLLVAVFLSAVYDTSAQAPNWVVEASDFQYTMTVTAFLNVNGRTLTSAQDKVGAFVGDQVRGVANLIHVESVDRYLAYLTINANTIDEEISFKIYDSDRDAVVSVARTLPFGIDEQHGSVFQAFSLANPPLNNEASIHSFSFKNADTVSSKISEGYVEIVLPYTEELFNLMPEFIISEGAGMFIDRELQVSGDTTMDFTFPIIYTVLSEDESTLNTYEVNAKIQKTNDSGFFSTNVITANNDGSNDYWYVEDVSQYDDYEFEIFDANGRVLWKSKGYHNDWNGHYEGKRLDRGKYFFKIENKAKKDLITGNILVIY